MRKYIKKHLAQRQASYRVLKVAIIIILLFVVQSLSRVWLLCSPMDCSQPGSSLHSISQARLLEWVAISFSRESSQPRDKTCVSCIDRRILYHGATSIISKYLLSARQSTGYWDKKLENPLRNVRHFNTIRKFNRRGRST